MISPGVIHQILDLARWAPSGDNTQPWRFEITGEHELVVHGFDTRDHCVYDLDGHASQISLGALLQTMQVAASLHGWRMTHHMRAEMPETRPTFDVRFISDPNVAPDDLAAVITLRSVQRRPLRTRSLVDAERRALEAAVGPGYSLLWIEGFRGRFVTALLLFHNAKVRLTMPEAYEVHRSIIDWGQRFSDDKVPDQALGADPLTLRLMRFVLASWQRVRFFNRFLAGTWAPRLQMDLLPAVACAAHVVIRADRPPQAIGDRIAAGQAIQRFWLTATRLGLWHQPEITPLIFASYLRRGIQFTRDQQVAQAATDLQPDLTDLIGPMGDCAVWMGRLGAGQAPQARSTRLPLERLLHHPA